MACALHVINAIKTEEHEKVRQPHKSITKCRPRSDKENDPAISAKLKDTMDEMYGAQMWNLVQTLERNA